MSDAATLTGNDMRWELAETVKIDQHAYYLVKTNGMEWKDFDLHVMKGILILHKMKPDYIRGRPTWIARIRHPRAD